MYKRKEEEKKEKKSDSDKKEEKSAFVKKAEEAKKKMEKLGIKAESEVKLNVMNWSEFAINNNLAFEKKKEIKGGWQHPFVFPPVPVFQLRVGFKFTVYIRFSVTLTISFQNSEESGFKFALDLKFEVGAGVKFDGVAEVGLYTGIVNIYGGLSGTLFDAKVEAKFYICWIELYFDFYVDISINALQFRVYVEGELDLWVYRVKSVIWEELFGLTDPLYTASYFVRLDALNHKIKGGTEVKTLKPGDVSKNGWTKYSNKWIYLVKGLAVTGWQDLRWSEGTSTFYFGNDGIMRTGWEYALERYGKELKWYYFDDEDGYMYTGWHYLKSGGNKNLYYFHVILGFMYTGFCQIGSKRYYFDKKNGDMKKGWHYLEYDTGKFNAFFFDDDSGAQLMGWHELKRDGNKDYFYFNINGTLTGFQKFETGGTFYFNEKGAMQKGWKYLQYGVGKFGWFFFNNEGYMRTGWQQIRVDGNDNYYYFDTTTGVMLTGFQKIEGRRFYLDKKNGDMRRGWSYLEYGNGKWGWFFFHSSGDMAHGWLQMRYEGRDRWFYFDETYGYMYGNRCYIMDGIMDGRYYCFNRDGFLQ